jgi:hypothetical protein
LLNGDCANTGLTGAASVNANKNETSTRNGGRLVIAVLVEGAG